MMLPRGRENLTVVEKYNLEDSYLASRQTITTGLALGFDLGEYPVGHCTVVIIICMIA